MKKVNMRFLMLVSLLALSGCLAPKLSETKGSLKVNLPAEALLQFVDFELNISEIIVAIYKNTTTYTQNIDRGAVNSLRGSACRNLEH